jgi:segregation and condensation protein B
MIDDRLNGDPLQPEGDDAERFGARRTNPTPEESESPLVAESGSDSDSGSGSEPNSEATAETGGIAELAADELRHAIEAVLFASDAPIPVRQLGELFDKTVHDVREAVEALREEYLDGGRAFRIEDIAGGVQLLTLPAYDAWIRRLHQKQREGRISGASFESLAVIAYKQPITRADLESIRGVGCGPTLKTLLDRGMIQVVGRDESLGRPLLYGTTRRFLESFGLSSLRELPQPESFAQAFSESSD